MYTYDGKMLIPKTATEKYAVVACDQYTSEPEYWQEMEQKTKGELSTLHFVFPEAYLSSDNSKRIESIKKAMHDAIASDAFEEVEGITYIKRTLPNGKTRQGIVALIDLEDYSFDPANKKSIRATEGTILERIPPRVKIREGAPLEFPHVMLLFDDKAGSVMEKAREGISREIYSCDLIGGGGKLQGYLIEDTEIIHKELAKKAIKDGDSTLMFAVGDGNHSLATAKACFEQKKLAGEDVSLARYALCEIVNIHDESLLFEPIHRVVLGADNEKFIAGLKSLSGDAYISAIFGDEKIKIAVPTDVGMAYTVVQNYIDSFLLENAGEVDYIHGEDSLLKITARENGVGLLMGVVAKDNFFSEILTCGVYPRKTFSMGEAYEKRYYFEGRRIQKEKL